MANIRINKNIPKNIDDYEEWEIEFVKLTLLGYKVDKILKEGNLNITEEQANSFIHSNRYRSLKDRSRENAVKNVTNHLTNLLTRSLHVLEEALDSKDERTRIQVAQDLLNRGGIKAIETKRTISTNFSLEDIKGVMKTMDALELPKESLEFIEIKEGTNVRE